MRLAFLIALAALPAWAEDLIGPDEFQAMSEGKTLHFTQDGLTFGSEQFYKNRTSTWQYADGQCTVGQWYANGDALCFVYEHNPIPQCWLMSRRGGDIFARLSHLPAGDPSEIRLSHIDEDPVPCPAPDLGV